MLLQRMYGPLNIIANCLAIIQPNQTKGRCLNTNRTKKKKKKKRKTFPRISEQNLLF